MFIPFKQMTKEEFQATFSTEEKCLEFLAEQKWQKGYVCKKCGHTNYCKGKHPFSRRCTKCKHDESAKVGTLFEGCRFPLPKAFYIAFLVCNAKKISIHEISEELNLRQMTCWSFKKKLHECIMQKQDISSQQKIDLQELIVREM